jgi:hypothetical protein
MKKILLFAISLIFLACENKTSEETEAPEETLSISKADTLEYRLSKVIPTEGGFSISEQAAHAVLSEIQYREQGIFYVYAPETDFRGTEVVKIKRADSNGAEIFSETITTLEIEVTE